jgi:glucan phosphoethanolaminetransferase (alkaline phosphatase superfamily)
MSGPASSSQISQRQQLACFGLAFMLVGVFGVYLKQVFLQQTSGILLASRFLGYASQQDWPLMSRLSLFAQDLLINMVLLPLVAIVLIAWLRPAFRIVLAFSLSTTATVVIYAGLLSLGNTGYFINFSMMADALAWVGAHPEDFSEYASLGSLVKLFLILGAVFGILLLPTLATFGGGFFRILVRLAGGLCLVLLTITLFAWFLLLNNQDFELPQQRAATWLMIDNLFDTGKGAGEFAGMGERELMAEYRALTKAAPSPERTPFSGKQPNSDVIFFVLETANYTSLLRRGGLETLPVLASLSERSLVGRNHQSTYPYSIDALFSVFSGLYPVEIRKRFLADGRLPSRLGLLNMLRDQGYVTNRYAYQDTLDADSRMFELLGESDFFAADLPGRTDDAGARAALAEITAMYGEISAERRSRLTRHLAIDLAGLRQMKSDIGSWKQSGQNFGAVFLPILGHAPWPDFAGAGDLVDQGRVLLEIQDAWLGELVALLDSNDWLEDTIIVVVADHGLRTRAEDPTLPVGTLSDRTFHVPLQIYAPRAFAGRLNVDLLTSHVDIAPTILDLLGLGQPDNLMQGSPLYAPEIEQRTTFLLARDYLGVDGFHRRGRYYFQQSLTGMSFAAGNLGMVPGEAVLVDGEDQEYVSGTLRRFYQMQRRVAELIALPDDRRD